MNDPIAVSSGITYDRESLQNCFVNKENPTTHEIPVTIPCPITKLPIQQHELNNRTHVITKGVINDFVSKQEIKFKDLLVNASSPSAACTGNAGMFKQSQGSIKGEVTSLRNGDSNSRSSATSSASK